MSSTETFIRVNGRGNAWPVFLGGESAFYDVSSSEDLSNASYSIIHYKGREICTKNIDWEILIDAGHHTVPFLIKNGNRIPEAVVLTHGHMDHTLGLDWLAQSQYFLSGKEKLISVYATKPVWQFVKQSYSHLERIINFRELLPGKETHVQEAKELIVTSYPVFHGKHASGASMLLFNVGNSKRALFTGDMLCPLLRTKDYSSLAGAEIVFIDSNNRFPYPDSNHGSIVPNQPNSNKISGRLEEWLSKANMNYLVAPHARKDYNKHHHAYFEEFLSDFNAPATMPHTVFDFIRKTNISNVNLIHYGGMEDSKYYNAKQLSAEKLQNWAHEQAQRHGLENVSFKVPEAGDKISL